MERSRRWDMDSDKTKTEINFEEIKNLLKKVNSSPSTWPESSQASPPSYKFADKEDDYHDYYKSGYGGTIPPLTISDLSTISISGGTGISSVTLNPGLSTGTYNTNGYNNIAGSNSKWTASTSARIELNGPEADIKINGESLMTRLEKISDRLNLLRPNPELEKDWDELRELGEKYRAVEAKLNEQAKMWKTLKDMPKPEL